MGDGWLVIILAQTRAFARSHAAHSCTVCESPCAPHFNRMFYAMTPIEEAIIE
jgi:hypothetical protein